MSLFKRKKKAEKVNQAPDNTEKKDELPRDPLSEFSTNTSHFKRQREKVVAVLNKQLQKGASLVPINPESGEKYDENSGVAMDSCDNRANLKQALNLTPSAISDSLLGWYGSQGFIGYQTMAIIAQNWLVDKACDMPGRDAIRNGYKITFNDGEEKKNAKIEHKMRKLDKRYQIKKHMRRYVKFGRVFGIRVAMFKVDFNDPEEEKEFYARPFNIDAIKPGSYKGIVQIDPYWLAPELDFDSASDPSSMHFYEPTWWRISGGLRVHRSHLVVFVNGEVADVLKPNYLYGGVSVSQKIFERVYAAERTANEGPQLALTKRTNVLKTDITAVMAKQNAFEQKILQWVRWWDNYGVKVVDKSETIEQFDTSLADLDAVIMTEFQLVASIANVPSTKLLGTTPKGFNATGEHEIETYNQELESIQENDLDPFLDRHYMMMMKSDIEPTFGVSQEPDIVWNPLDVPTAREIAEIREINSRADMNYQNTGAIDGEIIQNKLIADENSGYDGMTSDLELEEDLNDLSAFADRLLQNAAIGMDAYDVNGKSNLGHFQSKRGRLGSATLITSQNFLDQDIVDRKIEDKDYVVQISPEFKVDGKKYRLVMDGHHSFAAAMQSDKMPVFEQWSEHNEPVIGRISHNPQAFLDGMKKEGDYRNIITREKILDE
ncbi:MAG: DUF1073 domain-containing protein [Psychroserpens sp.]|nr:DUF1073 domain-containing protein [Psychroserpens sp.]